MSLIASRSALCCSLRHDQGCRLQCAAKRMLRSPLHHAPARQPGMRCTLVRAAQQDLPEDALEAPMLSPIMSDRQLNIEESWLAEMVQTWQDEEWQPQDNHRELGIAVGQSYRRVRSEGENDIGSILLTIATDLEAFDFSDTFTGNWEVANKTVELLMQNDGCEACCQGPDDDRRLETLGTAKSRQAEAEAAS